MAMDNKVYLIGLGSYLRVLQILSSLKENFINDSMNSISQTDFVFVKSYRLVDDGILRHLILQVTHRANTFVE